MREPDNTNIIKKKVEISKLCKACFNPRPPGSLVFLFHSHYRSEPAGKGMAGGQMAPTIVFTSPNVVLLGVSFQPPCHIVKGTLDATWERVKHDWLKWHITRIVESLTGSKNLWKGFYRSNLEGNDVTCCQQPAGEGTRDLGMLKRQRKFTSLL
jgi:hypothetical protein